MHISRAYGGRATDKFIVQDCGILNRLVPGDEFMADRGFTIQDLLFPLRVKFQLSHIANSCQMKRSPEHAGWLMCGFMWNGLLED